MDIAPRVESGGVDQILESGVSQELGEEELPEGSSLDMICASIPDTTLASGMTSFSNCGSAAEATVAIALRKDTAR